MFKPIDKQLLGIISAVLFAGGIAACETKTDPSSYSGVSEKAAVKKRAELREDVKGAAVKGEGLTAKSAAHADELRKDAVQINRDATIKSMRRDLEAVEKQIENMNATDGEKKRLKEMAESTEDLLKSLDKKYGELKLKPDADFDRDMQQAQAVLQNLKSKTKTM